MSVRAIVLVVTVLVALLPTSPNARADGAWCSDYSNGGGTNCGFHSYEQCMANISGIGGSCLRNPTYPTSTDARRKQRYN